MADEPDPKMAKVEDGAEQIAFFDPHFHIWDLSDETQSGHDSKVLFKPDGKDVYDCAAYEAEFVTMPGGLKHVGGAFVEAVSVCHVGSSGPEYSRHCLAEAQWVSKELSGKNMKYVLAPTCALEQPDVKETIAALQKDPNVRGIRQILNCKPDWPRNGHLGDLLDNEEWRKGYTELRSVGFSFDCQLNPHQFKKAAAFFAEHPDTVVIINHLGCPTLEDITTNIDQYWAGMKALAALPNTYIKLSMLCYANPNWDQTEACLDTIRKVIDTFGANRCMFASNFPVDKKDGWPTDRLFSAFLKLTADMTDAERRDLFGGTAKRAYRAGSDEPMAS